MQYPNSSQVISSFQSSRQFRNFRDCTAGDYCTTDARKGPATGTAPLRESLAIGSNAQAQQAARLALREGKPRQDDWLSPLHSSQSHKALCDTSMTPLSHLSTPSYPYASQEVPRSIAYGLLCTYTKTAM
eukprot:scaffold5265_cov227-Ochromonas_danica.AAC.1